jgi:hypothetical protein
MFSLLFALLPAVVTTPVPSLGPASVASSGGGSCDPVSGGTVTSATLRVSWTISNPDGVLYSIRIYENGILQETLGGTVTSWDKTLSGSVEAGVVGESGVGQWTSNWVYRVDVVRLSDNVVVSTQSTSEWDQMYGVCGGGRTDG